MIRTTALLCSVTLILFIACGSGGAVPAVEMIDGVRHVHNSAPAFESPAEAGIAIELVQTIGDLFATDENYSFYIPEDIARDAAGNLYILDAGNYRIQKFTADGKYIATFGRQGEGPGEFTMPARMELVGNAELYVYDQRTQRIDVMSTDGNFIRSLSFDSDMDDFCLRSDGTFITVGFGSFFGIEEQEEYKLPPLLAHKSTDGTVLNTFGEMREYDENTNTSANRFSFVLDEGDNAFLTFSVQNRIEKYSPDGDLLMRIDRPLNFEELVEKTTIERSESSVNISSGKQNRISRGIFVDDTGRIWVLTYDRQIRDEERVSQSMSITSGESGKSTISRTISGATDLTDTDMFKFEVFDAEGALLTTIPLTHFCDKVRYAGGRIYIIDSARGQQVYEYMIREK